MLRGFIATIVKLRHYDVQMRAEIIFLIKICDLPCLEQAK